MHKYFLFILFFLCQNVMRGQTLDSLIAKAIDFEGVQMDSTVHYFYKALELASPDDKGSLLTIHDGIATGLQMKGKFSEALYHGYEAIKYGRNSKDSIFIYSKLGSITSITDVHKADSLFKLAELLLNEETDSLTYQLIYSNYAIIKQRKGDLSESIDYYLKAVPYYNNDFGSAQIFQNISSVFASLGQFSRAEEYMLKAVDICEKNNYKFRNKAVAYQFAKILTELEKYEEAQKEIDLYMANNKSKFFAHSLQSKLFQKQGFWDKAYTEIQKAFPLPEGVQPELSLQVLENYANVLKQRKDFKTLDQISNQMVELGTKTGYPQYLKTSLNFQAVANSENGKFKEAFYNLKASKNLEDSIYRSQQVQNLNLLESDFKRKEQAQAIDLLNKDNQIKEVQLKQKNILLGFGLLGLAIISGLCYFLFRLFKKVKLQKWSHRKISK